MRKVERQVLDERFDSGVSRRGSWSGRLTNDLRDIRRNVSIQQDTFSLRTGSRCRDEQRQHRRRKSTFHIDLLPQCNRSACGSSKIFRAPLKLLSGQ